MFGLSLFVCLIGVLVFVFCWTMIAIKFFKSRNSPVSYSSVTSVRATVVDKYIHKPVSRMPGGFTPERYMVVFLVGNEKIQFAVSEYSFDSYKVNEKGTLTYRGSSLIDFK